MQGWASGNFGSTTAVPALIRKGTGASIPPKTPRCSNPEVNWLLASSLHQPHSSLWFQGQALVQFVPIRRVRRMTSDLTFSHGPQLAVWTLAGVKSQPISGRRVVVGTWPRSSPALLPQSL